MCPAQDVATTHFAPAGREPIDRLRHQVSVVSSEPLLKATIDALPDVVLILNSRRQVVGANKALFELFPLAADEVWGKRPGELLGCGNAESGPDGCGTASQCQTCGTVNALLQTPVGGHRVTRDCRMRFDDPVGALDLKVNASTVEVGGEWYTICVLTDISDQKRLALLSHLFFHDIVNTAGTIQGFSRLLLNRSPDDWSERKSLSQLADLADQLVDEIRAQRDLTYAESGDLEPDLELVNSLDLLERLRLAYARHPVGRDREIKLEEVWNGNFVTDHRLLGRVLGNMLKNALEATPPSGVVTVGCHDLGHEIVFSVCNATVMPEEVQMQIFQRSFSTKAASGRGVGTHSMRLFGERYLGGRVAFTSDDPEGTTFTISLPKVSLDRSVPRTAK
jgi:hypothetical protein